ncbi:glycerol-3-phosphate acyltransferase [bacterium]|nr:glycerol-3-phosphate acyltransferase [bacterium]
MIVNIFPIIIGYLLGSILPGYLIPKWEDGIDIRTLGDGNPGTTNVKRTLGFHMAILTGLYDCSKGLLAMFIAKEIFHSQELVIYLSGISAILGHVAPFYLGFRGGRGVATATGMLIFTLAKVAVRDISPLELLNSLIYLSFFTLCIYCSTWDENFLAVTVLPMVALTLIFLVKLSSELVFLLGLISFIFVVSVMNMRRLKMFTIKSENLPLWRVFIRPAGMSFFFLGMAISRRALITLIGIVLFVSFIADSLRILHKKTGDFLSREITRGFRVYKAKERKRISSITTFLLGVLLTFLLFKESIAIASLSFLVFGDMMAKIVGINYGKRVIFNSEAKKTLEGLIGFFSISISSAYFLWLSNMLPLWIGIVGAIVASIVEVFPFPVDDNVSVPVISGAIMSFLL